MWLRSVNVAMVVQMAAPVIVAMTAAVAVAAAVAAAAHWLRLELQRQWRCQLLLHV